MAVVGLGYWGPKLVRNLAGLSEAQIRWVCDLDAAAVAGIQRRHPGIAGTTRLAEVLDDPELEAVVVATPPASHHSLGLAALDAGKHVFIEKPLAPSVEAALDLIGLARRRNLLLMPGYTFLYSPSVTLVRDLIRQGEIGEVLSISMRRMGPGRHQRETSVVWDLGSHDFSILRYWLDEMPTEVAALGRDCVVGGTPDVAFVNMRFPSGCVAHVELSWLAPQKVRLTTIVGSKRIVVYDDASQVPVRVHAYSVSADGNGSGPGGPGFRTGAAVAPPIDGVEPLSLELRDFCRAVRLGVPLRSTPEHALDIIRWIEAVDRSVARGGELVPLGSGGTAPELLAHAYEATAR